LNPAKPLSSQDQRQVDTIVEKVSLSRNFHVFSYSFAGRNQVSCLDFLFKQLARQRSDAREVEVYKDKEMRA
jgi:hypothetical protein